MNMRTFLSRRLPFRLLQRFSPSAHVRVGRRILRVPTYSPSALGWIHWRPSWKQAIIAHFLRQQTGTFIDIGVNTGQTLADYLACESAAPYLGLEPNPQCIAFVDTIMQLNRLSNVTLLPVGAAAQTGLQSLFVADNSATDQTATLRADLRPASSRRTTWITTATVDNILDACAMTSVGFVKIDVEGAELEVLSGASQLLTRHRPPILCEVLSADAKADFEVYQHRLARLTALLKTHGYQIYAVNKSCTNALPALRPLDTFPAQVWTPATADDCDYLFTASDTQLDAFTIIPTSQP